MGKCIQIDVRRDSRKHRFLRALPHGRPGFAHVDFSVFLLIFEVFWHRNGFEFALNSHIDFDTDFRAFGMPFSCLLALFWQALGVIWGSWGGSRGRQRGSQKRLKWSLGARVAPGGFGDLILEDFGSLWDPPGRLFQQIFDRFQRIYVFFRLLSIDLGISNVFERGIL